ncbi:cell surface protein, partial [Klebsiella pneumoniae]
MKWAKKETPPPNPEKPPHKPPEEEEKKKKDNPPDSLLLKKVDEKGSSLAGAKFTLHYANGDFVKTKNGKVDENGSVEEFVTDDSGEILIESIEPGAYFMKEVEAPKGYEI